MKEAIINMKWSGSTLVMHNGQLANPFYEYTKKIKEITSLKKKTDNDLMKMAEYEWFGCLYVTPENRIYIPHDTIEATIIAAGAAFKLKKVIQACVIVKNVLIGII